MFKHLLLPTDGSPRSEAVIQKGIALPTSINAKVNGLHVIPGIPMVTYQAVVFEGARQEYEAQFKAQAEQYLSVVEKAGRDAGVAFDCAYVTSGHPYAAIIEGAKQKGCDLIVMALHGRGGAKAVLLGSETQKVLTHSQIPVLVYR
jgi:nucleotide-binding universal stress UspA family protein